MSDCCKNLHYACLNDHTVCIKALIKSGATINKMRKCSHFNYCNYEMCTRSMTPLHYVIFFRSLDSVIFLLELGADPYIKNIHGISAYDYSLKLKEKEYLKLILEHTHITKCAVND